jgi:hypothetical protein
LLFRFCYYKSEEISPGLEMTACKEPFKKEALSSENFKGVFLVFPDLGFQGIQVFELFFRP